ncbi:MAG: UDP-N-acetylmuramoyl-tripeptide--D-alanyl-D-alanine ligase [Oscillospiraceae bacterium]|nr:UDP-N-acetylmuramoyl-tripeptide--D-alanyl-D-alanine ligase [Oscillospiraceae bacterium]
MFQLNMYKNARHFKWLWKNDILFSFGKSKAKKPLVYTPRVVRVCITSGILFVTFAVLFMGFTANSYRTLFLLPIMLYFAEMLPIIANVINSPTEKAVNNRYIRDAKRIIDSMPNLITIAVTGSYGKTSTKFYLHKLLSTKYNVLMTPESFNTTMGVVKTVRGELRPTHEIFICEMGMMWKGDIAEICRIVKPKHCMITSIGAQHLETMKTVENIINEKFSVTDLITNGYIFLNYDNEYIQNRVNSDKSGKNFILYGVNEHSDSRDFDYHATDISVSEKGTSFTVLTKREQNLTASDILFDTSLLGSHNVQNIVGAIAVAHSLGISLNEMTFPVKRLDVAPHRLQISDRGGVFLIDDSFNSNPAGAKAALDVLRIFGQNSDKPEKPLKILITPGMVELGEQSHELNRTFGSQAAESADYALLIGQKQAVPIKEGLLNAGFPEERVRVFDSFNDGMAFAVGIESSGKKVILIENDLPDNY